MEKIMKRAMQPDESASTEQPDDFDGASSVAKALKLVLEKV